MDVIAESACAKEFWCLSIRPLLLRNQTLPPTTLISQFCDQTVWIKVGISQCRNQPSSIQQLNVYTVSLMQYCTSYKKALNRAYRFMHCFRPTWPLFFHLFFRVFFHQNQPKILLPRPSWNNYKYRLPFSPMIPGFTALSKVSYRYTYPPSIAPRPKDPFSRSSSSLRLSW